MSALDNFLEGADSSDLWALSAAEMLKDLGLTPADPWQIQIMQANYRRALLNCSRQSGKSSVSAALALHHALFPPGGKPTLTLLLSPSLRQSGELFRKVVEFYRRLGRPEPAVEENRLTLELTNGSRIVSLPSSEETVRGFSGVSLLVIDEAARVPDELYRAVRPMLAVSNGRLLCLSTPYGKRGFFYEEWHGQGEWERIRITADMCPRISAEFLADERRALGEIWYRQEYLCDFAVMEGLVYTDFEVCITDASALKASRAYAGIDFGWHAPSAMVVGVLDHDGVLHLVEEIYQNHLTDEELAIKAYELVRKWGIDLVWCDSSNPQSIEKLRRGNVPATEANKAVTDGIRAVGARIRTGRLKCWRKCANLIREMGLYHYDPERKLPSDTPVKEHDHGPDALRYLCMGIDRGRQPHGMVPPPPEPEPKPAVDYERDYRVSPPKQPPETMKTIEQQVDESDEMRRLQRDHLEENTFESWGGIGNW